MIYMNDISLICIASSMEAQMAACYAYITDFDIISFQDAPPEEQIHQTTS